MTLKDTQQGKIYKITLTVPFYFNKNINGKDLDIDTSLRIWTTVSQAKPIQALILIKEKIKNITDPTALIINEYQPGKPLWQVPYETLASEVDIKLGGLPGSSPVDEEIPVKDLCLYVHLPYKTVTFEKLLKGTQILKKNIGFKLSNNIKLGEKSLEDRP